MVVAYGAFGLFVFGYLVALASAVAIYAGVDLGEGFGYVFATFSKNGLGLLSDWGVH